MHSIIYIQFCSEHSKDNQCFADCTVGVSMDDTSYTTQTPVYKCLLHLRITRSESTPFWHDLGAQRVVFSHSRVAQHPLCWCQGGWTAEDLFQQVMEHLEIGPAGLTSMNPQSQLSTTVQMKSK